MNSLAKAGWVLVLTCGLAGGALAQAPGAGTGFPGKPVRWIVPFAPGGPSDLLARAIGQKLTEAWGQQVLIDNRAGANGVVGSEMVAKSAPDGRTLLLGTSGTHGINASLFPKLPYDTLNDFAPVTRIAQVPFVLVAHPTLPVRSVKELIRLAKARPGEISCASGGSPSQLSAELFKSMARIDLLVVPYKGAAPAITDVIAGQVSLIFGGVALAQPQIKAGRLRALAVTGARRSPVLLEVPTVAEAGVPGYEVTTWYGVLAPRGTPPQIVEQINGAVVRVLQLPDVRERLIAQAFEPQADTPDQFAALIRSETAKWAKVVKAAGIRAE